MSFGLVGKLALLTAMTVATYIMGAAPMVPYGGGCPYKDETSCCIYYCMHDSSSGCNGSSSCCSGRCG